MSSQNDTSSTQIAADAMDTNNSTIPSNDTNGQMTSVPSAADGGPCQSPNDQVMSSPQSKKIGGLRDSSSTKTTNAVGKAKAASAKASALDGTPSKSTRGKDASPKTPATKGSSATSTSKKRGTKRGAEEDYEALIKRKKAQVQTMRPSRRMPTFQSGPGLALETGDRGESYQLMNYHSTVFEVHLGATDFKFHVHEPNLMKSPTLADKVREAKAKPRRADNQILYLDPHDPGAFEQAVQYLYTDRFKLVRQNTNLGRLRELHELMALAKILQLRPLQKQVVATFAKSNLINKISIWTFFDWAEDMYYEELDFQKGPFQKYFAHNAPELLKNSFLGRERIVQGQVVDEDSNYLRDKIMDQVKTGGTYAMEMFKIMHDALQSFKSKVEPGVDTHSAAVRRKLQSGDQEEENGLFM